MLSPDGQRTPGPLWIREPFAIFEKLKYLTTATLTPKRNTVGGRGGWLCNINIISFQRKPQTSQWKQSSTLWFWAPLIYSMFTFLAKLILNTADRNSIT